MNVASQVVAELRMLDASRRPTQTIARLERTFVKTQALGVLAELASVRLSLGLVREAKLAAESVISAANSAGRADLARAETVLGSCLLASGSANGDSVLARGIGRALAIGEFDLALAASLNRTLFRSHFTDPATIRGELDLLSQQVANAPYASASLRAVRSIAIDYNREQASTIASPSDPRRVGRLHELIGRAMDCGASFIAGYSYGMLGGIAKRADLYSQALIYAQREIEAWIAADREIDLPQAHLRKAAILKCLGDFTGATEIARAILSVESANSVDVRNSAAATAQLAELTRHRGDHLGAIQLYLKSAAITMDNSHGWSADPVGPVAELLAAVEIASEIKHSRSLTQIAEAVRRMRERIKPAWSRTPFDQLTDIIEAIASGEDEATVRQCIDSFCDNSLLLESGIDPTGFRRELTAFVTGLDGGFETDLGELWRHVVHISGEDDETVRTRYIRANIRPVLGRLLQSESALPAHHQFEIVELARLSSFDLNRADDRSYRGSVRTHVRSHFGDGEVEWTTSVGLPRPVDWSQQERSCVQQFSPGVPVVMADLLSRPSFGDVVGVLQLYLSGPTLYWFWSERNFRKSTGGRARLSRSDLSKLEYLRTWCSPQVLPTDFGLASEVGAGEHVRAIGAVRAAMSPMVGAPEIMTGLLSYLPRHARRAVVQNLSDVEKPTLDALARAVGRLLPRSAWTAPRGRILISCGAELATLPLCLAVDGDGRSFLDEHFLTVLPPVDLLAAVVAGDWHAREDWTLVTVGNPHGDLSFAGQGTAGGAARLVMAPDVAAQTALLYRGHLVEGGDGRASMTGVSLGPTADGLIGQAELRRANPDLRTPRRVGLLACRAVGWDLAAEWGGLGPALLERGTQSFLAPCWPIIDARQSELVDGVVAAMLVSTDLCCAFWEFQRKSHVDYQSGADEAVSPHWWSGLQLLSL